MSDKPTKFWSCERKIRYQCDPMPMPPLRSYRCTYCIGWHVTSEEARKP